MQFTKVGLQKMWANATAKNDFDLVIYFFQYKDIILNYLGCPNCTSIRFDQPHRNGRKRRRTVQFARFFRRQRTCFIGSVFLCVCSLVVVSWIRSPVDRRFTCISICLPSTQCAAVDASRSLEIRNTIECAFNLHVDWPRGNRSVLK